MNSLKDVWHSYLHEVIPSTASYTQKTETQKAFYSGAAAYLKLSLDACDEDFDDEEMAVKIDNLRKEVDKFFKALV